MPSKLLHFMYYLIMNTVQNKEIVLENMLGSGKALFLLGQISEMCLTSHTIHWLHSLHSLHSDKIFEICNFHYANFVHEWKATCKIYMEVYYTHM